MEIKRLLTNICSEDLEVSKSFYTSMFSFNVNYDSEWFVHLVSEQSGLELGILSEQHDIVPDEVKGSKTGMYLTFVVEDVSIACSHAKKLGCKILQEPQDTFYGQVRMLLEAPEGTICDVSSPKKA